MSSKCSLKLSNLLSNRINKFNLFISLCQAYYYGDAMNIDKNLRERFRSSPYFEACENFCEKWDETSFDPNYSSLPLSHFEPMLLRLLEKKIYSAQDLNDPLNAAKKDLNVYDFDDWMGNNAEN